MERGQMFSILLSWLCFFLDHSLATEGHTQPSNPKWNIFDEKSREEKSREEKSREEKSREDCIRVTRSNNRRGKGLEIDRLEENGKFIVSHAASFIGFEITVARRDHGHIVYLSSQHYRAARIRYGETIARSGIFLLFSPYGQDELCVSQATETTILRSRNFQCHDRFKQVESSN